MVGAVQTRAQKKLGKQIQPLKVKESEVTEISAEDESLKRLENKKDVRTAGESKSWFWVENEILRRSFSNPKVNCGKPVKHLVIPKVLRSHVVAKEHNHREEKHTGVRQTTDSVVCVLLAWCERVREALLQTVREMQAYESAE